MAGVIGPIGPARGAPGAPPGIRTRPPERSFGEVLGEVAGRRPAEAGPAQLPTGVGPARGPADVAASPTAVGPARGRDGPQQIRRLHGDLVEGERRMDQVIRSALSGRDFSMQELIAIQATVLRHTQEVEAVSRVLDRLTGAVKTTLQTQV
ncbi:MAG: hypothetical protein HY906_10140 [Deltaproteobacteria bacterium]|nr:hypothetical protein [Deltaproteobacteria bacterium]